MHPRTTEVLGYLDTQRAALERAVAAVPAPLRARRPAPDRWSVAEVLGHLAVVEGQITQLLHDRIDAARVAGLGPERDTGAVVPTVDLARLHDRSRPIVARPSLHPPADVDPQAAWAGLADRREALRAMLAAADGLALSEVVVPNPVLGPLNAYQWAVFVGGHEARHTAQVEEISAALAG